MLILRKIAFIAFLVPFALCLVAPFATAQNGAIVIRDTEIENTLKEWTVPLFKAAGIGPDNVNIILIQSNDLNAFVAGGANIFLYTGLIMRTENPEELIGVIAHELGHITGGHLIATQDALERASYESIIGTILGLGAAIATGNSGAAAVISAGSQSTAMRRFLAHSRLHESSADQAALTFMEKAEINPKGMGSFLGKLESEELLPSYQQSEYTRTHPLTAGRIEALQTRMQISAYKDKNVPPSWTEQHRRMKAKLLGFIEPAQLPWVISDHDTSMAARYARTIGFYRLGHIDEALQGIEELLQAEPENPYFLELKGQMLVEFARLDDAVEAYKKAVALLPGAALIRIALAHALLESPPDARGKNLEDAIGHLKRALQDEPRSPRVHRLLATAYGRQGKDDLAKLHLAEEAVLQRRFSYAEELAKAALTHFEEGSRDWIKAKDILVFIENGPKEN